MSNLTSQERTETIKALLAEFARSLVLGSTTLDSETGERLFSLIDLALCGVMTEEQQADFIRQARNRGLLKPA